MRLLELLCVLLQCLPLLSFSPTASHCSGRHYQRSGLVALRTPLRLLPIDADTLDTGTAAVATSASADSRNAPAGSKQTPNRTFFPEMVVPEASTSVNALILGANASVSAISVFLLRGAAVGLATGVGVIAFKRSIHAVSVLLYEVLADVLPKPSPYWPIVLYPLVGAAAVSLLTLLNRDLVSQNIDAIARTVSPPTLLSSVLLEEGSEPSAERGFRGFSLPALATRSLAAVLTLGSGCSLGPEGTSVELGAGMARLFAGPDLSEQQTRFLFLAGTAAGVSAGFNAPITGVFFALECGNRYLRRNTLKFERVDEGPRADVAAIGALRYSLRVSRVSRVC